MHPVDGAQDWARQQIDALPPGCARSSYQLLTYPVAVSDQDRGRLARLRGAILTKPRVQRRRGEGPNDPRTTSSSSDFGLPTSKAAITRVPEGHHEAPPAEHGPNSADAGQFGLVVLDKGLAAEAVTYIGEERFACR